MVLIAFLCYSAISILWVSLPMCCEAFTASIGVTPFLLYCLIKLCSEKDPISFLFSGFPILKIDLRKLTFFSLIFSINILIYVAFT